jgi:hypothetical protein
MRWTLLGRSELGSSVVGIEFALKDQFAEFWEKPRLVNRIIRRPQYRQPGA